MGGDYAPQAIVEGVNQALATFQILRFNFMETKVKSNNI